MGRVRGKGKNFTLTNPDDPESGKGERIHAQKRRGRPQKPLMDEAEKEEEDNENVKKRKRNKHGNEKGELSKEETRSNGFRHNGSRRKNKPHHRAAEAGVKCK